MDKLIPSPWFLTPLSLSPPTHLINSYSLGSDTLILRARFQLRCTIGTILLKLCNLFHSYRSMPSWYWRPVNGPTFQAMLLHQPEACTQWTQLQRREIIQIIRLIYLISLSLCHSPCINPDQVAGPLNEPIHGNVRLVQVLHDGPPGTVQVVDVVLLAQLLNATPIRVGSSEPFAVSRTDINVYRTEVVVFLVARRPTARHLHVQLHRVHAQDHMAHVAQHIRSRHDPGEGW